MRGRIMGSHWLFFQVRRFHYLTGLFLLVELWIFLISGMMLNHSQWEIAQFWDRRTTFRHQVPLPALAAGTAEEKAAELMGALGVAGELESISWSKKNGGYTLSVVRPARITSLAVDLEAGLVEIEETSTDVFGLLTMLHTFNGVDFENGGRARDWLITSLWTVTMDLLSGALIFWALSGIYLWFGAGRRDRRAGTISLVIGLGLILFFLAVPAWL